MCPVSTLEEERQMLIFALTEVSVGMTFCSVARTTGDPARAERLRSKAREALDQARTMRSRLTVTGQKHLTILDGRIVELEQALKS
jgi:hypothetical protein